MAALHATMRESGNLEIRSDSKYVVDGYRRLISQGIEVMRSHRDLWSRFQDSLAERASSVRVVKVLGHAKWSDVHSGRETAQNKIGNHHADRLATEGVRFHRDSHVLRDLAQQNRQRGQRIQRMFLNILKEHSDLTEQIYEAREVQQREARMAALRPRLHNFARRR